MKKYWDTCKNKYWDTRIKEQSEKEEKIEVWEYEKEEKIEVWEYDLEDFKKGLFDGEKFAIKDIIRHPDDNRPIWEKLPEDEYLKIQKEKKKLYHEHVELMTKAFKEAFEFRYQTSQNKPRLVDSEIETFEKLLFGEKLPLDGMYDSDYALTSISMPSLSGYLQFFRWEDQDWHRFFSFKKLTKRRIKVYRDLYDKIIVNGERDYKMVNMSGGGMDHTMVEAMSNFLNSLYTLKNSAAEKINELSDTLITDADDAMSEKPITAKFYALYHWILIEMNQVRPFSQNKHGRYSRKYIEEYAKEHYPRASAGSFYKAFLEIDINNRTVIPSLFGRDYKSKLIQVSNNSAALKKHLRDYPNE